MAYTREQCFADTIEHIEKVRSNIQVMINELHVRANEHDKSKLAEPELSAFTSVNEKLADLQYGSEEYKSILNNELKDALDHHYANNTHHPEHYVKWECNLCSAFYKTTKPDTCTYCHTTEFTKKPDISQMDLLDILEMFCDWKAASERHKTGNINQSINHNEERFEMSKELADIFRNTVKYFNK